MKITETIERECCDEREGDLHIYMGEAEFDGSWAFFFCIHCGQIWVEDRRMDAAGSSETYFRKILVKP